MVVGYVPEGSNTLDLTYKEEVGGHLVKDAPPVLGAVEGSGSVSIVDAMFFLGVMAT